MQHDGLGQIPVNQHGMSLTLKRQPATHTVQQQVQQPHRPVLTFDDLVALDALVAALARLTADTPGAAHARCTGMSPSGASVPA